MPTFRDLYERLAKLTPEQLDCEIKIIPVGYSDEDVAAHLNYINIPDKVKIAVADCDIYHYEPGPDSWMDAGVGDLTDDDIKEMGIAEDEEYTLICHKGETYLRVTASLEKDIAEAHLGNLDTSILHL